MSLPRPLAHLASSPLPVILLTLALQGCASVARPDAPGGAPRAACPQLLHASARVGAEELRTLQPMDLYDALRWYRPSFLSGRSPRRDEVVVYVDGFRVGGIDNLRDVRASEVASVTFLSGAEATTRLGTGHPGGALMVLTHREPAESRCVMG